MTLDELKAKVPTFFANLSTDTETTAFRNHVIVSRGKGKGKTVKIYRFVDSNVRPAIEFIKNAPNVTEAREMVRSWGVQ